LADDDGVEDFLPAGEGVTCVSFADDDGVEDFLPAGEGVTSASVLQTMMV